MSKFTEGLKDLAMGMVIAVAVPVAIVKTVIGTAKHKNDKKTEIEVRKVDIDKCEPAAQEWMKRYNAKKNGTVS